MANATISLSELNTLTALVEALLETDERCRNSDAYLYLRILFIHAQKSGVSIGNMTVPEFLLAHHGNDFPIFESVRRTRQKAQASRPELAPSEDVAIARAGNERVYHDYALVGGNS